MADTAIKTIKLVLKQHSGTEMGERAKAFSDLMQARRTVRDFSDKPVSRQVIEDCLITAGSAPSGANRQPWHFAVVSDPAIKIGWMYSLHWAPMTANLFCSEHRF